MKLYNQIKLSEAEQDKFVFLHLMAMTGEKLHSKHDIAYELGARDKRIVELEKERDEASCHAYYILETCTVFSPTKLQAHNLEQRANGIMDVRKANVRKKRTLGSIWAGGHIIHNMQLAEEELRNQAKALKESKT